MQVEIILLLIMLLGFKTKTNRHLLIRLLFGVFGVLVITLAATFYFAYSHKMIRGLG